LGEFLRRDGIAIPDKHFMMLSSRNRAIFTVLSHPTTVCSSCWDTPYILLLLLLLYFPASLPALIARTGGVAKSGLLHRVRKAASQASPMLHGLGLPPIADTAEEAP
jgi:hypothetical protein